MIHGPISPWMLLPLLGFAFWPLVLALAVGGGIAAAMLRGGPRVGALMLAAACALELAVTAAFWVGDLRSAAAAADEEARLDTDLGAAATIDGVRLPAGTHVRWRDPEHTGLGHASTPTPAEAFGMPVNEVWRKEDGWSLRLTSPQARDGWACAAAPVEVSDDGRLRGCTLAAPREWNGWPIPAGTEIVLARDGGKLALLLPPDPPLPAPEIGRPLPTTRPVTLNPDGSLDRAYFELDSPLPVRGVSLWNDARWQYAPETSGAGRGRRALAVHGYLAEEITRDGRSIPSSTGVTVDLGDGRVTVD